jgi:hypothetical protein
LPSLVFQQRFLRTVKKLAPKSREAVGRTLAVFADHAHRPGLRFERVKGTDLFTIRVNRGDRVFLRLVGDDTYEVVDVGHHDLYRTLG